MGGTLYSPMNEYVGNPEQSVFDEDYDKLYGEYNRRNIKQIGNECYLVTYESIKTSVDYKDKVVLDIGADYGTTANFFIRRGAKKVICVERNFKLFEKLWENSRIENKIVPINLSISTPKDIDKLLRKYKPDIVKMDCEGCEVNLYNSLDVEAIRIPQMYIIELHDVPLISKTDVPDLWRDELAIIKEGKIVTKDDFVRLMKQRLEMRRFKIVGVTEWSPNLDEFMKHRMEVIFAERSD